MLLNSSNLQLHYQDVFDECYQNARVFAAEQTGLQIELFPFKSPFTSAQVLNSNFLP